jgi:hypothetical protein
MSELKYWWTSSSGRIEIELSREVIESCHHQGACDDDVEYWQSKLDLNLDRESMIDELGEYGAWSDDELNTLSNDELEQKILWIACGDIQDDSENDYNKEKDHE